MSNKYINKINLKEKAEKRIQDSYNEAQELIQNDKTSPNIYLDTNTGDFVIVPRDLWFISPSFVSVEEVFTHAEQYLYN